MSNALKAGITAVSVCLAGNAFAQNSSPRIWVDEDHEITVVQFENIRIEQVNEIVLNGKKSLSWLEQLEADGMAESAETENGFILTLKNMKLHGEVSVRLSDGTKISTVLNSAKNLNNEDAALFESKFSGTVSFKIAGCNLAPNKCVKPAPGVKITIQSPGRDDLILYTDRDGKYDTAGKLTDCRKQVTITAQYPGDPDPSENRWKDSEVFKWFTCGVRRHWDPILGNTWIYLYNVDDQEEVSLDGRVMARANYAEKGSKDIAAWLHAGVNQIRLRVYNGPAGGYTYGLQVTLDKNDLIKNPTCGVVGVVGCNNNDQSRGWIIDEAYAYITVPESMTTMPSN